jgi:hypothetical protein
MCGRRDSKRSQNSLLQKNQVKRLVKSGLKPGFGLVGFFSAGPSSFPFHSTLRKRGIIAPLVGAVSLISPSIEPDAVIDHLSSGQSQIARSIAW